MAELIKNPIKGIDPAFNNPDQLDQGSDHRQVSLPGAYPPLYPGQTAQEHPYVSQSAHLFQEHSKGQPAYSGQTSQNPVQNRAAPQTAPEPRVYHNYNGKLVIVFGTLNILLVVPAVILNVIAVTRKLRDGALWGSLFFVVFPAAVCGTFIVLAAVFAIVSGVHKTRGLIIAHLALAVTGSVFSFVFLGVSITAIEMKYYGDDHIVYIISIVWCTLSVFMIVSVTWSSVLSCKVFCSDSVVGTQP